MQRFVIYAHALHILACYKAKLIRIHGGIFIMATFTKKLKYWGTHLSKTLTTITALIHAIVELIKALR
jgi:hypothetical protein